MSIERYTHLPEYVREFLDNLTEEEVEQLRHAITWQRNTLIVLRFIKWVVATAIVAFTTVVALGDSTQKFVKQLEFWNK